ncbi:MAG TPA: hypothetical protein VE404_05520 [Verrucomicrobiae bacterium]|nr:hypothetical protein [Verrucomicrobiae bacterium]
MKKFLVLAAIFVLAAVAAMSLGTTFVQAGATTCADKHCPGSTHCCYSCSGSPFCQKAGVPCPECAPQ